MTAARRACATASYVGFFYVALTLVLIYFYPRAHADSIWDVAFFGVCSILLLVRCSRLAALAMFFMFAAGKIIEIAKVGINVPASNLLLSCIFLAAYAGGLRGSFAYHKLKNTDHVTPVAPKAPSQTSF